MAARSAAAVQARLEAQAASARARVELLEARLRIDRLNAQRRAIKAYYEGARTGRHGANWKTDRGSANLSTSRDLATLRARSRDLARNNPHVKAALRVWSANTTGTGVLQKSPYPEAWARWVEECDATGQHDYYGIQALVARTIKESGECLIRFRPRRPEDGLEVPLQLQVLEPDHLDHTMTRLSQAGQNEIIQGVEFDGIGRRVAYWMYDRHPGEVGVGRGFQSLSPRRIPASEILHVYEITRPGQVRGVPDAHAVIALARDLADWNLAELMRKKIEACHVMAIRVNGDSRYSDQSVDPVTNQTQETLEPGMIKYLSDAEEIIMGGPNATADTSYRIDRLCELAAGMGVTYEQITGDLSRVNFASMKAGLIEARQAADQWLWITFIPQFLQRVDRRWNDTAVIAGIAKPGVYTRPEDYFPPRRPWLDPIKDIAAMIAEARGTLRPMSGLLREMGVVDPEAEFRQMAEDYDLMREIGLVSDADGANAGGSSPEEEAPQIPGKSRPPKRAQHGKNGIDHGASPIQVAVASPAQMNELAEKVKTGLSDTVGQIREDAAKMAGTTRAALENMRPPVSEEIEVVARDAEGFATKVVKTLRYAEMN